jgi:hypothetical protein
MRRCRLRLIASAGLWLALGGCATPEHVRLVETPCPPPPPLPAFLRTAPPAPNFQSELRDFFVISPSDATAPPPTRRARTDGR